MTNRSDTQKSIIKKLINKRQSTRDKTFPFVSVICPTYNRKSFLPFLLYMYQYQNYPADKRELIILDDSPHSNQALIDSILKNSPQQNIRYIHHPERIKLGKKRNMLNDMSKGDYILCMDDDDYYSADKISYTISMMQQHGALISGSDQILIWYSHIGRIYKSKSFGRNHILNGTFCYHRNFLKKHRYHDNDQLGEEVFFLNNFTTPVLQLPPEKTILCISHSTNTFNKDFILSHSETSSITLDDLVCDSLLLAHYRSLNNSSLYQAIDWNFFEKIVIINLDESLDRWQSINDELASQHVPMDKIIRFPAIKNISGNQGRNMSHHKVLEMAQRCGWRNYLILEDDVRCVKQENTINRINQLLKGLKLIDWQVVIFGSHIQQAFPLKSQPGVVKVNLVDRACMYAVNNSYYLSLSLIFEEIDNNSRSSNVIEDDKFERYWQKYMPTNKWLALSPSFAYQKAGHSYIQNKHTDNTAFYFSKVWRENEKQ